MTEELGARRPSLSKCYSRLGVRLLCQAESVGSVDKNVGKCGLLRALCILLGKLVRLG